MTKYLCETSHMYADLSYSWTRRVIPTCTTRSWLFRPDCLSQISMRVSAWSKWTLIIQLSLDTLFSYTSTVLTLTLLLNRCVRN